METSVIERLYAEIVMGIPKASSKFAPLTEAQSQIWDKIAGEVQEIKDMGGIIAIPSEIPSMEIGKEVD